LLPVTLPYQPHSEYRPPYDGPSTPTKKRPSAAWFVVGGVLMVGAAVVFGIAIAHFVRDIRHTDAVFRATGSHAVTLPAGTDRGLYVPEGRPIPPCQVTDGSGAPLHFRQPDGRFTYGEWVAVRVFDTGDGNLVFTCGGGVGGRIRIASVPSGDDFAWLGVVGVLLPLGVGGLGFVVVLVTSVLWYSRRPRQPVLGYGAAPGYPPTYPPGYPPAYPPAYPTQATSAGAPAAPHTPFTVPDPTDEPPSGPGAPAPPASPPQHG
jgi:hypothetical protein